METDLKAKEQKFVEMLQARCAADLSSLSDREIRRLCTREIIVSALSSPQLKACPATLDALIDDVAHYLEKSLADFTEFLKEHNCLDTGACPE